MAIHRYLKEEQVHSPISFKYASSTERQAASDFTEEDEGKFAWQQDNNSVWMLVSTSPAVWVQIGGGA